MRREWIEMSHLQRYRLPSDWSPSMRREWIEMMSFSETSFEWSESPSMRREWIEILRNCGHDTPSGVSLHAEGVD